MTKTASVALATYNGARFIAPLLESLLAQSRPPDEIVVADDGSRDETVAIVEAFAARAPFPIRFHRHVDNVGVLRNFMFAFNMARGDIIFYADQDDVWDPTKIATLMPDFDLPDVHFSTCRSVVTDEHLRPIRVLPERAMGGMIRFPADTRLVVSHGHQMAFDRATLHAMIGLQEAASTLAPHLHSNLDTYIPFCASLLGALSFHDAPLVQFRRHGEAVSPLGQDVGTVRTTRLGRLAINARDDAQDYAARSALFAQAVAVGLVPPARVARYRIAVAGRAAATAAIVTAQERGVMTRIVSGARAMAGILLYRNAFSNARRLRELAVAVAATIAGARVVERPEMDVRTACAPVETGPEQA